MNLKLASSRAGDRTPPHNLEAEMSTLGAILVKPAALEELSDLLVDDFFLPAHREIYEVILELDRRRKPLDVVFIADELKARGMLTRLEGGEGYLLTLANSVPTAENIRYYAGLVSGKATARRLIAACAEIGSAAYGDYDVTELCALAREKVTAVETGGRGSQTVKLGSKMGETLVSMEQRAIDPAAYFVTTGLRAFDEKIGGLRGGNLIVAASRPGMGKSAWVLDVLLHAAEQGIPVLLFSMEMTHEEIIERSLAKRAEVNGRSVVSGRMRKAEWERIHTAAGRIESLPFWINDQYLSAPRICSEVRRWRGQLRDCKRALIAIDYLGLVESSDEDVRNRALELGRMTKAFKQMASTLKDPVILVAQLNRDVVKEERRPKPSDIRDSGAIEQDANMIVFPWWIGQPELSGRHPAHLIVGKNRGGPVGEVDIDWQPEFVRFVDKEGYGYGDKVQTEFFQ